MQFYLWYTTSEYDAWDLRVFDFQADVEAFMNERASNSDFDFKLVRGNEVKAVPIEVVKAYKLII